jgi:hypothetical protein
MHAEFNVSALAGRRLKCEMSMDKIIMRIVLFFIN